MIDFRGLVLESIGEEIKKQHAVLGLPAPKLEMKDFLDPSGLQSAELDHDEVQAIEDASESRDLSTAFERWAKYSIRDIRDPRFSINNNDREFIKELRALLEKRLEQLETEKEGA